MKTITYYKVRIEGIEIRSSYIMQNACFENRNKAIQYINEGWNNYSKEYLKRWGREIINEYERNKPNGYIHQITIREETGMTETIKLAIDEKILCLR